MCIGVADLTDYQGVAMGTSRESWKLVRSASEELHFDRTLRRSSRPELVVRAAFTGRDHREPGGSDSILCKVRVVVRVSL